MYHFSVCPNDMEYLFFFVQKLITIIVQHEKALCSSLNEAKQTMGIESKKQKPRHLFKEPYHRPGKLYITAA